MDASLNQTLIKKISMPFGIRAIPIGRVALA
jgi:hypothetical protein